MLDDGIKPPAVPQRDKEKVAGPTVTRSARPRGISWCYINAAGAYEFRGSTTAADSRDLTGGVAAVQHDFDRC